MPKTALPAPSAYKAGAITPSDVLAFHRDVLAFHRSIFGDLRMEADGDDGDEVDTPDDGGDQSSRSLEDVIAELGLTPEQIAGRLEASKKWEKRAKGSDRVDRADYDAVKAERDELLKANETDNDKAIREAREAGAQEARQASFNSTAKALLRMGLRSSGVKDDDLDEIVEQANLSAFADGDGEVDDEKVARYIKRNAATAKDASTWPGTGQGGRGAAPKGGLEAGREAYKKRHGQQ